MNEIAELLWAAVASANAAAVNSPKPDTRQHKLAPTDRRVYVIATSRDETRHATDVATVLARGCGGRIAVVVPAEEHVIVTSARAAVYDLPADELILLPELTREAVEALLVSMGVDADVMVARSFSADDLADALPAGATVVIGGRFARVFASSEERVARKLSDRRFEVIYVASPAESANRPSTRHRSSAVA